MIAADLARALDPALFAEHAGITPDPWQAELLRSSAPRLWLNASRQSGKSTTTALLAMHTALYLPGSPVLLLSPGLRQSAELFRTCAGLYRALGRPISASAESSLRLDLDNGSRIVSLPGSEATIRGFSGVRLLAIDEASRVPDDLFMAVLPMLAVSRGRMVAISTPWGRRGWWFEAGRSADWERRTIPATEVSRIPPEALAEARTMMGDYWFRQEFLCEFLDAQSQAFTRADVDRAFEEEVHAWPL